MKERYLLFWVLKYLLDGYPEIFWAMVHFYNDKRWPSATAKWSIGQSLRERIKEFFPWAI